VSQTLLRSLYVKHNTDIKTYPSITSTHGFDKGAQISIGDLHGNALKLIWFLLKHGVIDNISEQKYKDFINLYEKNTTEISKSDLQWFNRFVEAIKINQGGTIRLLGDELADRGSNDYFTLKIFEKLFDNNIPLEIVLSNHTADFIRAYENQNNYSQNNLAPHFVKSMLGLNRLIEQKLISKKEVGLLFEKIYTPSLKVLTYTINEEAQSIAIFSHAPIGLQTIESLCQKLKLPYCDNSLNALTKTIDSINNEFTNNYARNKKITSLLASEKQYKMGNMDVHKFPFMHLIWNRNYSNLKRPNHYKGYTVQYIHGHDSREKNITDHIYNLDNTLGKGNNELARYNVHYTHEKSAAPLKLSPRHSHSQKQSKPQSKFCKILYNPHAANTCDIHSLS